MPELDDIALLRQYAEGNSESAFTALVERHVNLVYSVALRSVGNTHAAEEITQAVFIILAKKARGLSKQTILSGWLYQTARLTAANFLRTEIRRQKREQEAHMQSLLNEPEPDIWPQIALLLDTAMGGLSEKDRSAIVLRFFESKTLGEVGTALGVSEDAAKMRVNRALEKLRKLFTKRDVSSTTATIAGAISANSVHAAPAALAKSISAIAFAKGAVAVSSSTLTLVKGALKIMAWTKVKTAIAVGAATILATGTTVFVVKEIATPVGADAARSPVEMQIKWVAGKKYVMRMEMNQTSEMTLPGQPKPVEQLMDMTQDFNMSALKELPNGGRQLELEFEAMTMELTVGDRQMMSFDSSLPAAQDSNNPVAPMLRKMVGARIQYFTDANGKVEKMEGGKELIERMTEGAQQPGQAAFNKGMFNEETLKQCGAFADMTPDHPVKIGDSWRVMKKMLNPMCGVLTLDLNNTFKGWEQHGDRHCARIEYTGSISSSGDSTMPNMSVKINKGKISGKVWYDPDLGMEVDGTSDQNMTMTVTTQGKPMTMQMNQKIHRSLVKTEDLAKN